MALPRSTSLEISMQRCLFGPITRTVASVSDHEMWRFLRALRANAQFDLLRIWLVGSRLQQGHVKSDIDIVLSPRVGFLPSDQIIESALWRCRSDGLYETDPSCIVDPCFRAIGPTIQVQPLQTHTVVKSIKLFSPKLMDDVHSGRICKYRRLGHFSIEYPRPAADTSYYGKLPRRRFDGVRSAYLRPAVEICPGMQITSHPDQNDQGS